jgi:hypothetical protein
MGVAQNRGASQAVDIPDASLEYCLADRVTRQTALAGESATIDDIWRWREHDRGSHAEIPFTG